MTSIKSLFNFGIYKNILKRFKWGGFLYFILLFLTGPFAILNDGYFGSNPNPEILEQNYIGFPIFLALIVPTIFAVLCFRDVHSSKQGIFSHSLPITRLENYITTVLAGLTLTFVPVLLNAVIYLIMSITTFGHIIPIWSVFVWLFSNFAIIFIMFSFAGFTAFLTGHTAAHIAINVLLHVTPLVIALGIVLVSELFLFGFMDSDTFIANLMIENTPFIWLYGNCLNISDGPFEFFFNWNMGAYIIVAIIFYCLGYLLYKNRKIEACGDVAAFKYFRPILKYTATFYAAILILAMVAFDLHNAISVFTIAIIVTAIVYFAAEMLIKKTFKVLNSYKGYLVFVLVMAVAISIFAFTDISGYENRIPKTENIKSVAIYKQYNTYKEPFVSDADLIENVLDIHKEIISDIPVTNDIDNNRYIDGHINNTDMLYIKYELENGKKLERKYQLGSSFVESAISKAYESIEYKHKVHEFDTLNIENVYAFSLRINARQYAYNGTVTGGNARQILDAVKLDIEQLSYSEIIDNRYCLDISFNLSETYEDNKTSKIFDESVFVNHKYEVYDNHFEIKINPNFKNTFELLKNFGYVDYIVEDFSKDLYICKVPVYIEDYTIKMKDDYGEPHEFLVNHNDCIIIPSSESLMLSNALANEPSSRFNYQYNEKGTYYMVFRDVNGANQRFEDHLAIFLYEELPDYLKKYIQE